MSGGAHNAKARGYANPTFETDGDGETVTGSTPPGLPQLVRHFDEAKLTNQLLRLLVSGHLSVFWDCEKNEAIFEVTPLGYSEVKRAEAPGSSEGER